MKILSNSFPIVHIIAVRYLSPTNTRGARLKLISERFDKSIIISRDYAVDANEQALQYLTDKGFNILGYQCGNKNDDFIVTDTFKSL